MNISGYFQEPFSYALWPIVFLILIFMLLSVALVVILLVFICRKLITKKNTFQEKPVHLPVRRNPAGTKKEYLDKITKLEQDMQKGTVTRRQCYQKLSAYIREFVFYASGCDLTKATLEDLAAFNVPQIQELLRECYEPEFARESAADAMNSISKAKRVIETWK